MQLDHVLGVDFNISHHLERYAPCQEWIEDDAKLCPTLKEPLRLCGGRRSARRTCLASMFAHLPSVGLHFRLGYESTYQGYGLLIIFNLPVHPRFISVRFLKTVVDHPRAFDFVTTKLVMSLCLGGLGRIFSLF